MSHEICRPCLEMSEIGLVACISIKPGPDAEDSSHNSVLYAAKDCEVYDIIYNLFAQLSCSVLS